MGAAVATQTLTNNTQIPLSIAVWLADSTYDHQDEIPNYISVTSLLKSPRQLVLGSRLNAGNFEAVDVADKMASKFGTAVHDSIEDAWVNRYQENLLRLGYPGHIVERILVNPEPHHLYEGCIPIYMEKRSYMTVGKYTIGGKFDFVGDGILDDFKSTGVYSYTSGCNEWKYRLQLSLYRWLNPDIITSDHANIQFIFTDWKKHEALFKASKGYPSTRMHQHKVRLMSVPETDLWVRRKLEHIDLLMDAPEAELPLCDRQDLWQDECVYKYYKNPEKLTRSSGNFDTMAEATIKWIEDGRKGVIKEVYGPAKGCLYCEAFKLCSQKDQLIADGTLKF